MTSLLRKYVCDWSQCICFSVYVQRAKCALVLPPCPQVISPCDILQKHIIEGRKWPIRVKRSKEIKSNKTGSEIRMECKWSYRRK